MRSEQEHTISAIGDSLIDTYNLKTFKDTKEILFFSKKGEYENGGAEVVEKTVREQVDRNISRHDMSEILYYVQTSTYTDRVDFDAEPDIINLKNGLLNLRTREFSPHTPEYLSMVQLPIEYKPRQGCPRIAKFLRETLDPEQVKVVVKMLGYLLLRSAQYEKAFLLVGEGANGKSVFIKLLISFVGQENSSNVALQELTDDRFASSKLYGKMLNAFADLKADRISDTGYFKALVSGDPIMAQRKHREPFEFRNYAKLVFSANQLPETNDKSYAFFRRVVIIPFNQTFEGAARDENLIDKLTTSEELSGLLNVALEGLKRLIQEKFSDIDLDDIRQQYDLEQARFRTLSTNAVSWNLTIKIYLQPHMTCKQLWPDTASLKVQSMWISENLAKS